MEAGLFANFLTALDVLVELPSFPHLAFLPPWASPVSSSESLFAQAFLRYSKTSILVFSEKQALRLGGNVHLPS